jgi:hypothetical protein
VTSLYPDTLDTLPINHEDLIREIILAQTVNDLADAVNKIEAILGINPNEGNIPEGVYASVVARLNGLDSPTIKNVTPPYTPIIGDFAVILNCQNTTNSQITIPTNVNVPFPIGGQLLFRIGSTGAVTFVGDTGVTVNSRGGLVQSAGMYALITALKNDLNSWTLGGDLV